MRIEAEQKKYIWQERVWLRLVVRVDVSGVFRSTFVLIKCDAMYGLDSWRSTPDKETVVSIQHY